MRRFVATMVVCAPLVAQAEVGDNFIQGVAGYATPISGSQYSEGIGSGGARVGIRGGRQLLSNDEGTTFLGLEAGFDWRPVTAGGESEQQVRLMVGPRLTFAADPLEVYFRATAGYERLYLGYDVNPDGFAFEPGFGAAYRRKGIVVGAEVAVPVSWHPEVTGDDFMDGFAGADLQIMTFAGAAF
jgi:hypothetical protein